MVIDINRPNNAAASANSGRSSSAQVGGRNETITNAPQPNPSTGERAQPTRSGESVQLSREAQQLQKASDKLKDVPSSDKERVDRLKQAVAEGSYLVDSAKVAQKLMNFESNY